jgi:hypothetical protein
MDGLHLLFKPEYTPKQMFSAGVFGGNYFDKSLNLPPIERLKFPPKALSMLKSLGPDKIQSDSPSKERNKYGVNCGSSYSDWKKKNWLKKEDPYGWVNWYIQYYYGRRSDDDIRQIKRWKAFKIRHGGMAKKYPNSDKIKQGLLQWSIKP